MTRAEKQRELEITQLQLEQIRRETGLFQRNKFKTIAVGALITVLGPVYLDGYSSSGRRSALENSGVNFVEMGLGLALFYSVAVTIAHFVWKKQEKKKIIVLEERIEIIKMELDLFKLE